MKVINALHEASDRGLRIYFMHGNRDFLLGRKFLRATGSYLLDDETVISIMGEPTLLMHGDTLCTQDTAYLKWRKKSRNWFMQKLFLWKSLEKRRQVAEDMRAKSKAYTSTAAENIMDVTQEEVERVMRKYQVRHLIHGHTHRPAVHTFELDGKTAKRTVLAPWHDEGSVLICDDLGKQEIIKLS
jgi:UDP-2,3-diacylglucosamine hydrolase